MSRPKVEKDPRYLAFVVQTLLEIKLAYGSSDEFLEQHFSVSQCAGGRQWRRYRRGEIPHQTFLRICHQAIAEKRMKYSLRFLRCATAAPYQWQRQTEYDELITRPTRSHTKAFEKAVREAFSKSNLGQLSSGKLPSSRHEAAQLTLQYVALEAAKILRMDGEALLSALNAIDTGAQESTVELKGVPDY